MSLYLSGSSKCTIISGCDCCVLCFLCVISVNVGLIVLVSFVDVVFFSVAGSREPLLQVAVFVQ